jgi:hypothetical protein
MMGTIRPGIRGGLLELFYAVYEKDANSAWLRQCTRACSKRQRNISLD